MVTFYVTYSGDASVRFDRNYWINNHLPLVRETWIPHGLVSSSGFFPSGDGGGFIAICPCVFRDEAAIRAALAVRGTKRVMDDIKNFTSIQPDHNIARHLNLQPVPPPDLTPEEHELDCDVPVPTRDKEKDRSWESA